MSRTHYQIGVTQCRAILAQLITYHGISSLTPGIVRKALGDGMPKTWYASGLSIDWSIAMDDVMQEMVPKWSGEKKEEKGLF